MPPIINGFHAIGNFFFPFLGILLTLVVSLLLFSTSPFRKIDLTAGEHFSLGISAWLPVWLGMAVVAFLIGRWTGISVRVLLWVILSVGGGYALYRLYKNRPKAWTDLPALIGLASLFAISLVMRMVHIENLLLPPYVDSATHYRITEQLVQTSGDITAVFTSLGGYYHIGTHLDSAAFALLFGNSPGDILLALGAFLLAALPFPLYLLINRETGFAWAGLWTVLLAGWGWPMPGHAVEWGKYPMLAGLLVAQLALGMAYLAHQRRSKRLFVASLACTLLAALFHSRVLILIGIIILAWVLATLWTRLPGRARAAVLLLAAIFLAAILINILNSAALSTIFRYYIRQPFVYLTILVCLLIPFGLKFFPIPVFASLLTAGLLMGALSIPVSIPTRGLLTLLDRPFVEAVLYLPLAALSGLGYAGLHKALQGMPKLSLGLQTILWGCVFWIAVFFYPFFSTPCCNFFSTDDAEAVRWINQNLPADAVFLAAGASLAVTDYPDQQVLDGMDAGVWIPVLTNRTTRYLPGYTDFSSTEILEQICQQPARYIYVGNMPGGFSANLLDQNPGWYQNILMLPKAKIYQVTGCLVSK